MLKRCVNHVSVSQAIGTLAAFAEISISDCKVYFKANLYLLMYLRILYSKVATSMHVWRGLF